jgi:hypothetical protein
MRILPDTQPLVPSARDCPAGMLELSIHKMRSTFKLIRLQPPIAAGLFVGGFNTENVNLVVAFPRAYEFLSFRRSRLRHSPTKATKAASAAGGWRRLG